MHVHIHKPDEMVCDVHVHNRIGSGFSILFSSLVVFFFLARLVVVNVVVFSFHSIVS